MDLFIWIIKLIMFMVFVGLLPFLFITYLFKRLFENFDD